MNNKQKTKKELIHEIDLLKRQAANLQKTNEKITKALKKLKQNNKHASVKENSEITRWESEEQYRMVVENAGEGIFIAQDGMIKFCNRETVNISGYTEETLTSRPFLEFIHREDRDMVWEQHVKRLKGKENPPTYSSRIYTADGSIKWIEISGVAVEWKGRPAAINFLKDITDRKLAEMALLSEREKYENLVELSPFGMMLIEKDGTIIYINHKFSEIFGYSIQEIPDLRTWGKKAYPDGQYRRQIISAWREEFVLLREGKKQINTHTVVTANGEKKIIAFTAVGLKNDQILVASEDITEHRKLEAQLRQSEKMKAIGTLAGGIAHDVNNILMGIQGYVSLLLLSSDPNHSNYDKLKAIESQVQSGADLTRQILGYARGGRYEVKPIDMNDLIGRTAVLFGRTKKEISIHQKYSREIWAVDADPAQMEQVFLNLFVNAWEAMPEGGSLFIET
jgi:two-component system cell cycle sensor histidine kinase/response regulator CckA